MIKQFTGGKGGGVAISGDPNFVAISAEYCEAGGDGLNTGRRLVKQMDINPYSATFKTERIFVVATVSDVCPISVDPFFKPTGNKRCKRDESNRYTGGTEQEERDVNPRSPSYNTSKWVDGPDDLNACPLPDLPFLRVLAENAGTTAGFVISATIKDGSGQLFTVTRESDGTGPNYADLYRDFGTYTIVNVRAVFSAGVAINKFISRIYSPGIFDRSFVQSDAVNTPVGGSCTNDDAGSYELILNANKAIHFVFADRVAIGQFTATRTAAFARNDCGPGKSGTPVNFTKTYSSFVSQADADSQKAADNNFEADGQAFANNPANGSTCVVNGCAAPTNVLIEDLGITERGKPASSTIIIDTAPLGAQWWNARIIITLFFQDGKAYIGSFTGNLSTPHANGHYDANWTGGTGTNPELAGLAPDHNVSLEIYSFVSGDDTVRAMFSIFPDGSWTLVFVNSGRSESGTVYDEGYGHNIDSPIDYNDNKIYLYDKNIGTEMVNAYRVSYQGTGRHTVVMSGDTMFNYDIKETTSSPVIMMLKPDTGIKGTIAKVCSLPPDYTDMSTPVNFNI